MDLPVQVCKLNLMMATQLFVFKQQLLTCFIAWFGFLRKGHAVQINNLLKHAFKFGHVKSVLASEQLLENYDDTLLK